ncbi:MAG: replication-associated recombination protein A [Alphaproteobacteria bacterium]|nr:replication-associated recombination protein A [Alphaproteobacteria bacterium]
MSARPPLPDRLRPQHLGELVGQERWLGPEGILRRELATGSLSSLVLWGPPGCGKTTLARLLAAEVGARFVPLSAVLDGVKRLREVVDEAETEAAGGLLPAPTVVFVDEIHRWNRAQQDALLPHVERGTVVLVGATTENPSFELVAALRSRLRIVRLEPLSREAVRTLLDRALTHPDGVARPDVTVTEEVLEALATVAAGDARRALLDLERVVRVAPPDATLGLDEARATLQRADLRHDRDGDDHHDVVSALIKSLRGSDPDAALYWLARMIEGGESVRYIARRLVVFAAEDVGNADPRALAVAVDAFHAAELLGLPEARIPLAQAATWLACAPKSNAAYKGIDAALELVRRTGAAPVPLHLRNAPTALAEAEGFGRGYRYPHDHPYGVVRQRHLPEGLGPQAFYRPTPYGDEKTIRERLAFWAQKLATRPPEEEG